MSASARLSAGVGELRAEAARLDGLALAAHAHASDLFGRRDPMGAGEVQRRAMDLDEAALELRLQASELEAVLAHAILVETVAASLAPPSASLPGRLVTGRRPMD